VNGTDGVSLLKRHRIVDHMTQDRIAGLVSVIGVKFTSARAVARKVIDLVCRKLGRGSAPRSLTEGTAVHGGQIDALDPFLARETRKRPHGMDADLVGGLIQNYGSAYTELLGYLGQDPVWGEPLGDGTAVIKAEVLHGIREEMAQKLGDVVMRRTQLGSTGHPGEPCLRACADIMSREMGWNEARTRDELDEVRGIFSPKESTA
jgi:glycerol-3-phosphate dehydrogenase